MFDMSETGEGGAVVCFVLYVSWIVNCKGHADLDKIQKTHPINPPPGKKSKKWH